MNLRKLNLGLVALLLGFGLVLTQSAFTPTKKANMYGKTYVSGDVHWVSLDGLEEFTGTGPLPSGKYRCNPNDLEICSAEFSSPPAVNAIPTGTEIEGDFEANP